MVTVEGQREHGALRERIVDGLRADIIEGRLAPGTPLRTEEVMERFGVSNSPLREAFAQLAAEGLVDVFRNRGAFVATVTHDGATDLLRVGSLLWNTVYLWSIPRLTDDDIAGLVDLADRFERHATTTDPETAVTEAEQFQGLIAARCGSVELLRTIDGAGPRLRRLVRMLDHADQLDGYGQLNAATLGAARARDVHAAIAALGEFSDRVERGVDAALAASRA